MKIYGGYLSPFTCRVLIQIKAKGLDIPLEAPPGGLKSETFLAMNPMGKIPVLDTGQSAIPESEIICDYLEEISSAVSLSGDSPSERAEIRLTARIFDLYVMNAMLPIFGQLNPKTRDQKIADAATTACLQGLGFAEARLDGSPYAVGNRLTLADCMAAPTLLFVEIFLPMFDSADPLAKFGKAARYWAALQKAAPVAGVLEEMKAAISGAS